MTGGSSMQAMLLTEPPHSGQVRIPVNVNTESGETAKVFTLRPDWVFTMGRNAH